MKLFHVKQLGQNLDEEIQNMNNVRRALDELPWYKASKKEWVKRGYKVKRGRQHVNWLRVWNGMYYNEIKIFHVDDCCEINGKKASIRRDKWLSQFDDIVALWGE